MKPIPAPSSQKNKSTLFFLVFMATHLILMSATFNANAQPLNRPVPAPEFTQSNPADWINSKPLSLADFKGKVVLIDFWTFGCWNCYRSFPWLNDLENRYHKQGLEIIGVHTPEFPHEKIRQAVVEKARQFNLNHPIMLDNNFIYWKAMHNRYWPAYYLIDANGLVRYKFFGETHKNSQNDTRISSAIESLINEAKISL